MREAVAILTPELLIDDAGGQDTVYVEDDPIFVSIRPLTSTEQTQFAQVNANISHVIFGHYTELCDVPATARIRWLEFSVDFDIAGSPINDPQRAWTKLTAIQRFDG
jgi:hypothetical protein